MNVIKSLKETVITDDSGREQTIKQGRVYNVREVKALPDHLEIVFSKGSNISWTGNPLDWESYALNVL